MRAAARGLRGRPRGETAGRGPLADASSRPTAGPDPYAGGGIRRIRLDPDEVGKKIASVGADLLRPGQRLRGRRVGAPPIRTPRGRPAQGSALCAHGHGGKPNCIYGD